MSFSYNRVIIAGNLTRDPESRAAGQSTVANFGLAINRRFKGPDGQPKEEATFVDVEAWGRTAELVVQYLHKGAGAHVEGRLRLDSWEDQAGQRRTKLKVIAESVQFTGGKGDRLAHDGQGATAPPATPARPASAPAGGDEPPF